MVYPNIGGSKQRDAITIAARSKAVLIEGVSDHASVTGFVVMDVQAVDDDISHKLQCDLGTIGDVDVSTTTVNGLVACHHELLI